MVIFSVSISDKQKKWLKDTQTSASKLLQSTINEEMKTANDWLAPNLKESRRRIAALVEQNQKLMIDIDKLKSPPNRTE